MTDNEITRLIAEKVMGYRWADAPEDPLDYRAGDVNRGNFDPIVFTEDAFLVVDKMIGYGWEFSMRSLASGIGDSRKISYRAYFDNGVKQCAAEELARCRAICIAALRVVGVEV